VALTKSMAIPKIDNGWCFYTVDTIKSLEVGPKGLTCPLGDKRGKVNALLFGDSFAGHNEPFWDALGKRDGIRVNAVSTNWCFPSLHDAYNGKEKGRAYQQCQIDRRHFADHAGDYDVVILAADFHDVAKQDHIPFLSARYSGGDYDISRATAIADRRVQEAHATIRQRTERYPNVMVFSRRAMHAVDGKASRTMANGVPFSADGSHIGIDGSLAAAQAFMTSAEYVDFAKRLHALETVAD